MYTPRLFWHCIQRHTGSTWANQSAAADAGLHIVNAKGDPPISKTRLYSLVYAGLLYFIIGITTYSYTTVNHFDHFDPCRYLTSNPLFQTIQILSFFWFEILTSALFCFLTKYPICPAMKAGWNLYSNCIGFVPVSPLRTSSCSSVELSSGHHSRWWDLSSKLVDGTISWWCFMGIFDGDIVHGSIRNGPCTIHLNLAHIFCLLILETQRLTALRDLFGDFWVPSVDFWCWTLQVLTSKGTQCGESRMVPAGDFAKLLRKRSVSPGISMWNTHWKVLLRENGHNNPKDLKVCFGPYQVLTDSGNKCPICVS